MIAALTGAAAAGFPRKSPAGWPAYPRATLAMATALAAMFAAQTAWPPLLPAMARTPALLDGELWRAVTALFVQDGGVAGTLFNLTALVVVGTIAELRFGSVRWLAFYLGGGIATEFLAMAWQPNGAGNSIACFALAGALALKPAPSPRWVGPRAAALVAFAAGLGLLVLQNIHGIGLGAGAALAAVLHWRDGRRAHPETR